MKQVAFLVSIFLLLISCSEEKSTGIIPTKELSKDSWNSFQTILTKYLKVKTHEGTYGSYTHNLFDYDTFKSSSESKGFIDNQSELLKNTIIPIERTKVLTFWINAYNFYTLVEVYNHYPTKSMKDIGWDNKVHIIGGKFFSLDEMEHKILRPLKEPRIHFAINCASISCPSLKANVYTPENLEKELTEQTQNAMVNPIHLNIIDGDLHVTELFDWFEEDFEIAPFKSVEGFIKQFAPKALHKPVEDSIDYNWQLNKP